MAQSATDPEGFTPFPDVPLLENLPPLPDGKGVALVTPFRLSAGQLAAGLAGAERVDYLPKGSAGITFVRYGTGYYGVPFCDSPDDGVNCYPVGPGPDDDPSAVSCVCLGPQEPEALLGPPPSERLAGLQTIVRPACQLTTLPPPAEPGRFVCEPRGCIRRCQRVWIDEPLSPPAASGSPAATFFRLTRVACICV